MNIALDYDKTYTANKPLWDGFIDDCLNSGVDIRLVTARSPNDDPLTIQQFHWLGEIPVIYCDGVAKKFATFWFHNFPVDIWIDDKPEGINANSTATPEILAAWRNSEEYHN